MNPKNRQPLADRVARAGEASLAAQGYVAPLDVLLGIGWLDASSEKRWRLGQIECLESVIQTNLSRISEAMELFRSWAETKALLASETAYVGRAPHRPILQFSRSGHPTIERLYRTHWVSPVLSERKRERLAEGESAARPGGDPTAEHGMGLPPMWRNRGPSDDGTARTGLLALRRPRRPGVPCGRRCAAQPARQGEQIPRASLQLARKQVPDASLTRQVVDDPASYA